MKRDQPPIGILLTMGARVIDANGGLRPFLQHFTNCLNKGGIWLQKSRAAPQQDIAHVYIVLCNRVWDGSIMAVTARMWRKRSTCWMGKKDPSRGLTCNWLAL